MDKDGYVDSDDMWFELPTKERRERLFEAGVQFFEESNLDSIWQNLSESKKKEVLSCGLMPLGCIDWNKLSLDQLVAYLEEKHQFSSRGESFAINRLIEYYKEHKNK